MFVIGIDPHRGSHAAVVIDRSETVLAVLELAADRRQRQRLLDWSVEFTPRLWAVEGATGTRDDDALARAICFAAIALFARTAAAHCTRSSRVSG